MVSSIRCTLPPQSLSATNEKESYTCILPDFADCVQWYIEWTGIESGSCTIDGKQHSVTLSIPKNHVMAIQAYPITQHGNCLTSVYYPAGCVYPFETVATWQGGYTATMLSSIYKASTSRDETASFCNSFNWRRFTQTLIEKEQKSTQTFYNPWLLDKQTIINAITSHTFTVYKLSLKNIESLTLSEVAPGHTLRSRYIPEQDWITQTDTYTICTTASHSIYYIYDTTQLIELYNPFILHGSKRTLAIRPLPL
ncbi:MAG: hypothetical protein K6E51_09590 [Treponema sp.]|nr:hypothetical protein [Treponema sp.]